MAIEHIRDVLARIPAILMGMYESPAEECLGERLRSVIDPTAKYQTQVWVNTWAGPFRLDILLTDKDGRRIAIEVDGKDFHEPVRDHWRTVFIVGDRQADVVYRVLARDLKINLVGVLAGLAAMEPLCFRQAEILRWKEITDRCEVHASADADEEAEHEEEDEDAKYGRAYRRRRILSTVVIESRFCGDAMGCEWATIKAYHDFAIATGLKDLDAIQEAWKLAHPARPASTRPDDPSDFLSFFE